MIPTGRPALGLRFVVLLLLGLARPTPAPATPPVEPVKVACIGDSITEGAGLSNPAAESYPVRLQRLLGSGFVVRNYGVSGRTLLKKGDYPYWRESAYTQSRNWGPNVVLIKLGTNDSKPQNWRHGTNYVAEFEEFIASYRTLTSQPRVIVCTPAPVFAKGAFDISPGVVATNIAPSLRDLASRLGLEVIDYHERLAGHGEWFPDTVHPNTRGMAVMASIAFATITRSPFPQTLPILSVGRGAANRAVVSWPVADAGPTWVLQSATRLGGTNAPWAVADPVPFSDGTAVRATNLQSGPRFFRLWQP